MQAQAPVKFHILVNGQIIESYLQRQAQSDCTYNKLSVLKQKQLRQSVHTCLSSSRNGASLRVRTKYSKETCCCCDSLSDSRTLIGVIPMPPATSRTLECGVVAASPKVNSTPLKAIVFPGRMLLNIHFETIPSCNTAKLVLTWPLTESRHQQCDDKSCMHVE